MSPDGFDKVAEALTTALLRDVSEEVLGDLPSTKRGDQILPRTNDEASRECDSDIATEMPVLVSKPSQRAPIELGKGQSLDLALANLPLTDLGNIERFAHRNRDKLLYCAAIGWLYWDGRRWQRKGAWEVALRAAQNIGRLIKDEADALLMSGKDFVVSPATYNKPAIFQSDRVRNWGVASENFRRFEGLLKQASVNEQIAISEDELDADPFCINVRSHTLRAAKREDGQDYIQAHPHNPHDYITKVSPVVYDPAAVCPRFNVFLDQVHPPRPDDKGARHGGRAVQKFLAEWGGYCLTGDTGEHKAVFHYGRGRNGKSVYTNVLSYIMGDYAGSIPIESFLNPHVSRSGGAATPDIASLPGVRFLTTSEPKKGATLDEAFVKLLTGGDVLKARHLNKDFFEFRPQCKVHLQGNYRPKIFGTDDGIWARVTLLSWGECIPEEKRDPKLFEKLKEESSGILNWLLDGLRRWLEHGLKIPDEIVKKTEEYRSDSDPLGRFLDDCTKQASGCRVPTGEMYRVFCGWAKFNGETEWSQKGLTAALKDKGLSAKKANTMFWTDIQMTKTSADFMNAEAALSAD